jgi:DNA mismatch repair ATPase MutL
VQNSVDAKAKNVTIKITGNSVMVRDDGMGMDLTGLLQARQLGLSNKSQYEDVGFRGIGIYSGFDICNRLLVTTKTPGEAKARILEFDFGEMKAPGSQGALLPPSPLRTVRESFVLIPLKPF